MKWIKIFLAAALLSALNPLVPLVRAESSTSSLSVNSLDGESFAFDFRENVLVTGSDLLYTVNSFSIASGYALAIPALLQKQ